MSKRVRRRKIQNGLLFSQSEKKARDLEFHIKELEDYQKRVKDKKLYSIGRFDIMIVALATIGIGYVTDVLKNMHDGGLPCGFNPSLAIIAQVCFLIAIITNLFSQLTSRTMSKHEIDWVGNELYNYRYNKTPANISAEEFQKKQEIIQANVDFYSNWTNRLNDASLWLTISAIVFFITFSAHYY